MELWLVESALHPVQHFCELTLTWLLEIGMTLVGPGRYLAAACRDFGLIQSVQISLADLLPGPFGSSVAFLNNLILLVGASVGRFVVLSVAEVVQHRLQVFISQASHVVHLHELISLLMLLHFLF